jgi:hypothetical protein
MSYHWIKCHIRLLLGNFQVNITFRSAVNNVHREEEETRIARL